MRPFDIDRLHRVGKIRCRRRARIALIATLASLPIACGGGGDPDDVTDLAASPNEIVLTSTNDKCYAGAGGSFFIFGGTPPYRLFNSQPEVLLIDRTEVARDGGEVQVRVTGTCLDGVVVAIQDAGGRRAEFRMTNKKKTE